MKKTVISILFFISCFQLYGQHKIVYAPYYKFDIYTTKDGLSNNRINDVFQDSKGFLWVATEKGLNKFDGYNFDIFINNSEDSTTISGNIVSSIAEDKHENVWIGSNQGLDWFNRKNNEFIHIFPYRNKKLSKEAKFVRDIIIDKNGTIWFDTADGVLHKYNSITKKHQKFKHEIPVQIFTYYYHNLFDDGNGNIWIGGRGMNPCKFNKKTGAFVYFKADPLDSTKKRDKDVTKYYIDINNTFWIAGVDGLYKFDEKKKIFNKFMGGTTYDIIDFNSNELWFSNGMGLKILNRYENKIYSLSHLEENKFSLPSNYVFKLYKDNAGNLWIGTMSGLCKYSPSKNKFKTVFHIFGNNKAISSDYVTTILQDIDSKIWIGTKNNGIDILDTNFIKIDHIDNSKTSKYKLASNRVSKLYRDRNNNIYIGLWAGKGFNVINRKNKINKLFTLDKTSQKYDWYNDFYEDTDGVLWIGTWSSYGLVKFDRQQLCFVEKPLNPTAFIDKLGGHFVSCVNGWGKNKILIGTTNLGLTIFDKETYEIKKYNNNENDSLALWGQNVGSIFIDSKERIWIGAKGLNLFNPKSETFSHFTVKNGLCDNNIMGILEDKSGYLWVSTLNGLSRIDVENSTFTNFYEKDGLASDVFTSAALKLKDGRLVFGNKTGITVFTPEQITCNKFKPKAFVTKFKIFEKEQNLNNYDKERIELKFNNNYIGFEFASNDLSDTKNNKFAYRLDGFENKWHYVNGNEHNATYTYLEPDKYTFLLKTANANGNWSDTVSKFQFTINPPFWKTWWFILFEIFALAIILFLIVKYRERKLKEKHFVELLEQRLLRSQMNPHFIFNALGAIQSYIFTHNPIEAGTYLSRFAELMRAILYGSREEYISLAQEIKALDNYLLMQKLRFDDKFDYNFDIDSQLNIEFLAVPPMLVQPFLENSIEHGFKNLNRKGKIEVTIQKKENMLMFVIEDNGKGIQKEKKQKENHKPMALDIIKQRLKILNKDNRGKYNIRIENNKDRYGAIKGVIITFFIPVKYL